MSRASEAEDRSVLREPDFFEDRELSLIYIAKKLKEALALEQLLTEAGLDYLVEPIIRGSTFPRSTP